MLIMGEFHIVTSVKGFILKEFFHKGLKMAKFASLFPSASEAEHTASELSETKYGDDIQTQIITRKDWNAIWQDSDKNRTKPGQLDPHKPGAYLDLWIKERTLTLFADGLQNDGAVLVINVPEVFSEEARKIIEKNNSKIS